MSLRPLVVCAAMKMRDGFIVPGIRHYSPEMRKLLRRCYGEGYHKQVAEQGFVDQFGNFLTRETAYEIAFKNGQIRRDVSKPGTLFSENLY